MYDFNTSLNRVNEDIAKMNQNIDNAVSRVNQRVADINAKAASLSQDVSNKSKLNSINNQRDYFDDWKTIFSFYNDCAEHYKNAKDFDKAQRCIDKMQQINQQLSHNNPVPDYLIDDDLLQPFGGASAFKVAVKANELSSSTGNSYGSGFGNGGGNSYAGSSYGNSPFGGFPIGNGPGKTGGNNGPGYQPIDPTNIYGTSTYGGTTTPIQTTTQTNNQKEGNPYKFTFTELTEEDKLEEFINADLPVFLHGKSGCGKSARIKEIDPDCIIIYLASAKPDMVVGKTIVVDGETKDVPPEWYKKLCEKCEKEPDKDHILFFDEITNATPAIQGMAFNIILDKVVNGKWKLPDNVKVVAAGNEDKESLSANKLSEPLFRRFNHLYIETTLESWLLWASKHNIHPAIYAFVASKGDGKEQVLRTECNGKEPCVDPRKWEMASKLLYKCKNPKALTATIGKKLTEEFINFCKLPVITLEQVINGDYDKDMDRLQIDEGYATLIGLAACNDKDIEVVRKFIKKYVIPDQYQNFVMMWTRGDQNRIDKIKELDMLEKQEEKGNVR